MKTKLSALVPLFVLFVFLAPLVDTFPMSTVNTHFESTYVPHDPIVIYDDALFTPENGVTSGNGTEENPYVIEGWNINATVAIGIRVQNTSSYFIIRNCKIYGDNIGVWLDTIHGQIENCEFKGESYSSVSFLLSGSSSIVIRNNSLSNSGGIDLINSCNNVQIENNHLANCTGIRLYGGHYSNVVKDNLIEGPYQYASPSEVRGIIEFSANSNLNTAMNNTILSGYGFRIDESSDCTLRANTMENASIWIDGLLLQHFRHDIDDSNTVNGKPVYYFWNQTLDFDASNAGSVIVANSTGRIGNLHLEDKGGVIIAFSHEISITNSSFSNGGIYARQSDKITILGAHLENSSSLLLFSVSNTSITNCRLFDSLVLSAGGFNNTFRNNTINGFGIVLFGESNSQVENNVIIGNKLSLFPPYSLVHPDGIYLFASSHNTIVFNSISNFTSGLGNDQSISNIFYKNTLADNEVEVNCTDSADNVFYHNNFLNYTYSVTSYNSTNIWDDGYPSGGNYWSDYVDADMFSGPYQNETGSDGIWDSPYVIDEHNRDNYSLVNPYTLYTAPAVVEWNKTYGTINIDLAVCLLQTSDGGFVMAGPWNYSIGCGIVKTDPNGNLQWTRNFEVDSVYSQRCALFETAERALVFGSTINLTGNLDVWFAKIDEEGRPIWNHTYGGAGEEILMSAVQADDDGFLLIAWNYTVGGGTWLVKTDAQGNVEWEKAFGDWIGCCGVRTVDGGFALIGVAFQSNSSSISIVLLKMDAAGNVLWNQTFPYTQTTIPLLALPRLLQVVDRGFVLVGTQIENGDSNILLVKTDEGGNIEWNKTYNNNGWESGVSITEVYGGFAVLGSTNSSTARGLDDVWLVRTDFSGNVLWDSAYGGEGVDLGCSIITTNDGGLAFAGGTNSSGYGGLDFWLVKLSPEIQDNEPPVIKNVRHEPLYPMEDEVIHFYADVTDNVAVASVQLNYTLDGGATWLLKDMSLFEGDTYSTSLGPYLQFQILGFYVIAYDTSGNWNWGSELVPLVPQQPEIAPIVVSDVPSNPLPNGIDVGYNVTDAGIEIIANVTELEIGGAGLTYFIWYSVDGGITWIEAEMTYIGDFVWTYVIPSLTNILFKVRASDGSFSRVYWIIIGPWTYPIYLYFADNEQYYPVKGLDFDYEYTRDYNIADNKKSYDTFLGINYRPEDLDHDGFPDVPAYAYMNPKMIDDGCLVVEYWIYYAFNNYLVLDNHEHDFESIYLWVDIGTGRIKEMALSQHMWTNNYVFDISKPQKRLNIAVETGGHGMQLLQDNDNDGYPDLTPSGYYARTKPDNDDVITPPFFMYWTISPSSFVGKLYPWVIYDVRGDQTKHHLFGDDSILTEGLDSFLIFPNLIRSPTGTVDETATRLIYSNLVDLIGSRTLLKTSIALKIPMLEDYPGLGLAWMVSAPWYRIQFREPAKQWNRASFEICASKQVGKLVISALLGFGLSEVIEGAVAKAVIPRLVGLLASNIIGVMVDPVESAIIDPSGRVLGLQNGFTVSQIPEGLPVTNRSLTDGLYDLYLMFTNHTNDYVYEVRGITESDNYNFTVFCTTIEGRQLTFEAKAVPIHAGEVHRYVTNWTMLEDQQLGVDVYVDQDGDGNFEHIFSSDGNLTGDEFLLATTTPAIQSCNSNGVPEDIFDPTQSVYVRGSGYLPSTTYDIYLVSATIWTDGMFIPQRIEGTGTAITSDSLGNLSATLLWSTPLPGKYDIVVDVNGDGYYNATIDALDKSYIQVSSAFLVIPEYWFGTILWIAACITAFGAYRKRRQLRLEQ